MRVFLRPKQGKACVIHPLSLRNGGGKRRRSGEITDDEDDNGSSNSNTGKDNNDGTEQRQCKN